MSITRGNLLPRVVMALRRVALAATCCVVCVRGCQWFAATYGEREAWQEITTEQARELVRQNPTDAWPRAALGLHLVQERKLDEALEQFQQEARLDPKDVSAHLEMATVYDQLGCHDKALAEWRAVYKLAQE